MLRHPLAISTLWLALLATVLVAPAEARNVPGSASAVQSRIDQAVASSILDTTMATVREAALFDACRETIDREVPDNRELRRPCEWGISISAGVRHLNESPDGFGYDFTSVFGTLAIAHAVSPTTSLIAVLIAESGDGDLDYSDGTLKNDGIGGLVGAVVRLHNGLDFTVLGGAEWLNYETTRTGGAFNGEYDAVRYLFDTRLRGLHDGGTYFLDYGAGLRFVHQDNDGYQEFSGGLPSATVAETDFSALTAIGDLKIGTHLDGITPYLQATGYFNLLNNTNVAADFGPIVPYDDNFVGRFGAGVDMDAMSGKLSIAAGLFVGDDGFQGADGVIKFVTAF